jgi:hypothetical protein
MNENYIFSEEAIITREACASFIKSFDDPKIKKLLGPRNNYAAKNKKYFYSFKPLDVTKYAFFEPLFQSVEKYKYRHPFLRSKVFGEWGITRTCNFQKYEPGNHYSIEHCEHGPEENSHRVLAWMLYLNDIEDDGGTYFPQQDVTLQPRAGDLHIWPAHWTHSHCGIPAASDSKYLVTGWCEFPREKG